MFRQRMQPLSTTRESEPNRTEMLGNDFAEAPPFAHHGDPNVLVPR